MQTDERTTDKPKQEKPHTSNGRKRLMMFAVLILVIVATVIITYNFRRSDIALKSNSPRNVAYLMTKTFKENNFASFQMLLTEQARIQINSEQFGVFQKINTDNALFGTYSLVRLENGRLLMVYMTPPDEVGLYKIQDVKLVPLEMNNLFNHVQ